jgi:hypothetical protein
MLYLSLLLTVSLVGAGPTLYKQDGLIDCFGNFNRFNRFLIE